MNKTLLITILAILIIFLTAYLLDIDIITIFQNEFSEETPDDIFVINDKTIDTESLKNEVFFVFDKRCKKYGPFSLDEALVEVNKGFDYYGVHLNLNTKLIEIQERKESHSNTLKT